jgi:lysine 6-dehydrogenase
MTVLVFGVGLQGRAALHELVANGPALRVLAADRDPETVAAVTERHPRVQTVMLDAADTEALGRTLGRYGVRVVLYLGPPALQDAVAGVCVRNGASFVSTNYTRNLDRLDAEARAAGVAVLPQMGLDPGIDLVLARLALDRLDTVEGLDSYGGGLPAPDSDNNVLRYKVTWSFEGVLGAYRRPARVLRDGQCVTIPPEALFDPENTHTVDFPGLGTFEAFPNGDAPSFRDVFGLTEARTMGRYTLRWPGHCDFWRKITRLGLLDDTPTVLEDGIRVSPFQFLRRHLEPRLQLAPEESDLVVIRVRAWGQRDGQGTVVVWDLVDRRDTATGLYAMNRTVGFTAAIAARMILDGTIAAKGVLHPARDVPGRRLMEALGGRGILATERISGRR